jgi:SHS2 domain-containing protein
MRHPGDFEFLEHTADLKFIAYGSTLDECFRNSARAMFSSIVDPESVGGNHLEEIELKAETLEILLHDFLSELLFLFETRELLFREFRVSVDRNGGYRLKAELKGDRYDPKKHDIEMEIKAVTYHELFVEKRDDEWTAQVLCDI